MLFKGLSSIKGGISKGRYVLVVVVVVFFEWSWFPVGMGEWSMMHVDKLLLNFIILINLNFCYRCLTILPCWFIVHSRHWGLHSVVLYTWLFLEFCLLLDFSIDWLDRWHSPSKTSFPCCTVKEFVDCLCWVRVSTPKNLLTPYQDQLDDLNILPKNCHSCLERPLTC